MVNNVLFFLNDEVEQVAQGNHFSHILILLLLLPFFILFTSLSRFLLSPFKLLIYKYFTLRWRSFENGAVMSEYLRINKLKEHQNILLSAAVTMEVV
jgi:hypothetical protein